jgi:hypothetical protein
MRTRLFGLSVIFGLFLVTGLLLYQTQAQEERVVEVEVGAAQALAQFVVEFPSGLFALPNVVYDEATGNVGIGTTNPTNILTREMINVQ